MRESLDDLVDKTRDLIEAAYFGSRPALARLISYVERYGDIGTNASLEQKNRARPTYVVGVTGAPGAGKSTLVDKMIAVLRQQGSTVAVLAVDPTSPFSGGAILGDRIRMQQHALDDGVFLRSLATRGHLGGLSAAIPEVLKILELVCLPLAIVETVGVGQVEVEIASEADTTVVVVNPDWGDSVQANKAGLMEIADIFVINKADHGGVEQTRRDLESMLSLGENQLWRPSILQTVASDGTGVEMLVKTIKDHRDFLEASGVLVERRGLRALSAFERRASRRYLEELDHRGILEDLKMAIINGMLDPTEASEAALESLLREDAGYLRWNER